MSTRSNIEIDYCPECRGVWLDRGELDKIIERSAAEMQAPLQPPPQTQAPQRMEPGYATPPRHSSDYPYYKKKKREGFLSEIFDFD